ncbi:MAG: TolC family protein [Bdellovibrionota bacterium]
MNNLNFNIKHNLKLKILRSKILRIKILKHKKFSKNNLNSLVSLNVLLLLIASFLIFPLNASAKSHELSFKDCIKELKENNSELVALNFEKKAAIHKIKASKANFYPSLDANIGAASNKVDKGKGNNEDSYNWGISLSQNLFNGFKDEATLNLAYANEAQNLANILVAEAKISAELKQAFSEIVYYKNYLQLSKKIVQRRKENFEVVKLRYEAGNENKGSFLKSKAQLNEAEFELKQAKRTLEASKYNLAKILGRNSIDNLNVKGSVPHTKIKISNTKIYLETHPKLLLAKANVALALANVKISNASDYPKIDAAVKSSTRGGSINKEIDHSIGINATAPLLTFGRNKNNILEAESNLSSMKARETLSKQEIKSNVKLATSNYLSAKEKVMVDKMSREASEVRAEIGRNKYNIGLLTFENWDIIENDLISYQKSELKGKHNLIVSEANFEQALGLGVLND